MGEICVVSPVPLPLYTAVTKILQSCDDADWKCLSVAGKEPMVPTYLETAPSMASFFHLCHVLLCICCLKHLMW